MKNDPYYDKFIIKKYKYWVLCLHEKQFPYIGRCYAWCNRENAETVVDMTKDESIELNRVILPEWNRAVRKLFSHDTTNFSIMCNETRHLHAHFIPRYKMPRIVYDLKFVDPDFSGNYAPYPQPKLPLDFLLRIKRDICKALDDSHLNKT